MGHKAQENSAIDSQIATNHDSKLVAYPPHEVLASQRLLFVNKTLQWWLVIDTNSLIIESFDLCVDRRPLCVPGSLSISNLIVVHRWAQVDFSKTYYINLPKT